MAIRDWPRYRWGRAARIALKGLGRWFSPLLDLAVERLGFVIVAEIVGFTVIFLHWLIVGGLRAVFDVLS